MTGLGVKQVRGFAGAKATAIGIKFSQDIMQQNA
jgi:hypothetical protein